MAIAREQFGKLIISARVMSWNSRGDVGSSVTKWSSTRQTLLPHWNVLYHVTHINRGKVFLLVCVEAISEESEHS
jgi:hypothetical protein